MGLPQAREATETSVRERWMIEYEISGDLRYISHHDTLRLFQRAFARAEFPLRYSAGFNPHPRLSILLPRPVGVASKCEAIVVELQGRIEPESIADRVNAQMPAGAVVRGARPLAVGERPTPDLVRYRLDAPVVEQEVLLRRMTEVLSAESCVVSRSDEKGVVRKTDIRPYLVEIRIGEGGVEFTLRVTGRGTARPAEVAGLLGFDAKAINHKITRLHVTWARSGKTNDDTVHDER